MITIRFDNGTKFTSTQFQHMIASLGINLQTRCVHTPQQNEMVKRKHRYILDVSRALMNESYLPLKYWGEAVVYLNNRMPSSKIGGKTPFYILQGTEHQYDNLWIFGCLCFTTNIEQKSKFEV